MFDLQGKVALVTGSTTGLGKAMALHLGRAGAKVAMNYARNQERAEEVARLQERKEQMNTVVEELERQLDESARGGQADNPEAARAFQNAATMIRETVNMFCSSQPSTSSNCRPST